MADWVISEALSFAPGNALSVVLPATLPLLFALYLRNVMAVNHFRPSVSLSRLESIELQRTARLYERAFERIKAVRRQRHKEVPAWRAWRRSHVRDRRRFREELEDLESFTRELRLAIIQLRGRPLRRYKSWLHLVSAKFAFGRSVGCYSLTLTLVLAALCYFEPILWAPGISASFKAFVLWQAVKGRVLLANWMAANFVAIAMPLLYLGRRATLSREHRPQLRNLKAFAAADPDHLIGDPQDDEEVNTGSDVGHEVLGDCDWSSILGVSSSASIQEVKQAYKALVKKNHPDRVQDMSPSFVKLAETETKKLNAAYEEALIYFQQG